jgi:hypothetical protein
MPDPEAHEPRGLRPDGPILSEAALRSTKAGLAAVFLLSFAFATFGPSFNLTLGYALMTASFVAACLGIGWADRAAHEARRNPALTNGIYAKSGTALSAVVFLLTVYYIGLLSVLLFLFPMSIVGFLLLYELHRSNVDAQARREVGA